MRTEKDPRTQYILDNFGQETELHKKATAKSQADGVIGMQISASEGQLLQFLAQVSKAKKIVEIGCLHGYSALWFLEAMPTDGTLHLLELAPERIEWMKSNMREHPKFSRIQFHSGDAETNLKKISAEGPFDLCFIDANKNAYANYLTWAEGHIRQGGLIIGDNTFLWGAVYDPALARSHVSPEMIGTMQEFNSRLADRKRYLGTLLPTAEGLTVAQKLF